MTDPVLQTIGLNKSFGALKACQDVTLDLRQGEVHALIGPNGAGKSTLIQQIAGGLRPDTGRVMLAGEDVTGLGTAARAQRGLARTFQISALAMEDTVLQNAMLGALGVGKSPYRFLRPVFADNDLIDIAIAALERVGLASSAATRAGELSHGQRRQLEVAIALTLAPKAFVMDEPMAGLGASGSKSMTTLLAGLRAEAPILLVEHDMDAVFALADRISVLVYGQIIATGTVNDIRRDPDVRSAYLGDTA